MKSVENKSTGRLFDAVKTIRFYHGLKALIARIQVTNDDRTILVAVCDWRLKGLCQSSSPRESSGKRAVIQLMGYQWPALVVILTLFSLTSSRICSTGAEIERFSVSEEPEGRFASIN